MVFLPILYARRDHLLFRRKYSLVRRRRHCLFCGSGFGRVGRIIRPGKHWLRTPAALPDIQRIPDRKEGTALFRIHQDVVHQAVSRHAHHPDAENRVAVFYRGNRDYRVNRKQDDRKDQAVIDQDLHVGTVNIKVVGGFKISVLVDYLSKRMDAVPLEALRRVADPEVSQLVVDLQPALAVGIIVADYFVGKKGQGRIADPGQEPDRKTVGKEVPAPVDTEKV